MSTTFRCKRSGNLVKFHLQGDIDGLRKHEGYEEVPNAQTAEAVQTEPVKTPTKEVLKLKRKVEVPSFLQE